MSLRWATLVPQLCFAFEPQTEIVGVDQEHVHLGLVTAHLTQCGYGGDVGLREASLAFDRHTGHLVAEHESANRQTLMGMTAVLETEPGGANPHAFLAVLGTGDLAGVVMEFTNSAGCIRF